MEESLAHTQVAGRPFPARSERKLTGVRLSTPNDFWVIALQGVQPDMATKAPQLPGSRSSLILMLVYFGKCMLCGLVSNKPAKKLLDRKHYGGHSVSFEAQPL